jgi:hypothetical protein
VGARLCFGGQEELKLQTRLSQFLFLSLLFPSEQCERQSRSQVEDPRCGDAVKHSVSEVGGIEISLAETAPSGPDALTHQPLRPQGPFRDLLTLTLSNQASIIPIRHPSTAPPHPSPPSFCYSAHPATLSPVIRCFVGPSLSCL